MIGKRPFLAHMHVYIRTHTDGFSYFHQRFLVRSSIRFTFITGNFASFQLFAYPIHFFPLAIWKDLDECGSNGHNCHQNGVCSNTYGGYSCQCANGYSGDGRTCIGNVHRTAQYYQEIIKVRERIPQIGPLTKVISPKLFLDIVPSFFADITRALRRCFRGGSVMFRFVSFQSKGKPLTLWGCLFWYFDYEQRAFGSRYVPKLN